MMQMQMVPQAPAWMIQAAQQRQAQQAQIDALQGSIGSLDPRTRFPQYGMKFGTQLGGRALGPYVKPGLSRVGSAMGLPQMKAGFHSMIPTMPAWMSGALGPAMAGAGVGLGAYDSFQSARGIPQMARAIDRAPIDQQAGLRKDLAGGIYDRAWEDAITKGSSGAMAGSTIGPVGTAAGAAIGFSSGLAAQIMAAARAGLLDDMVRQGIRKTGQAAAARGGGVGGTATSHFGAMPLAKQALSRISGGLL